MGIFLHSVCSFSDLRGGGDIPYYDLPPCQSQNSDAPQTCHTPRTSPGPAGAPLSRALSVYPAHRHFAALLGLLCFTYVNRINSAVSFHNLPFCAVQLSSSVLLLQALPFVSSQFSPVQTHGSQNSILHFAVLSTG